MLVPMPLKLELDPGKHVSLKSNWFWNWWLAISSHQRLFKGARKPIIADGGVRTDGDIAKSIRFGASMVMIGSMFAGHLESPGKKVEKDGKVFKEYFGSASEYQKVLTMWKVKVARNF